MTTHQKHTPRQDCQPLLPPLCLMKKIRTTLSVGTVESEATSKASVVFVEETINETIQGELSTRTDTFQIRIRHPRDKTDIPNRTNTEIQISNKSLRVFFPVYNRNLSKHQFPQKSGSTPARMNILFGIVKFFKRILLFLAQRFKLASDSV